MRFIVENISGLDVVAEALLDMPKVRIIAFEGQMGSGKTTLIKRIGARLGVTDEVNSPTFSIVNEYVTKNGSSVYHFDFYRIRKVEEAFDLGYENYFYSGNFCLIEWPERIEQLLPEDCVKVQIEVDPLNENRIFTIGKNLKLR